MSKIGRIVDDFVEGYGDVLVSLAILALSALCTWYGIRYFWVWVGGGV